MDKTYPTLYARDSKGKVLQWKIKVLRDGNQIHIQKSYGEFDGGQTIRYQRDIQGVNIGKSNETNPYEQACFKAESNIRRQEDKGYVSFASLLKTLDMEYHEALTKIHKVLEKHLPKTRLDASGKVKPMKAQQYYRSAKDKIKDEKGKTITLDYWTDPNGKQWDDRKYYYLKNPNVVKEDKAIITKFPCLAQPKINGIRATIHLDGNDVAILSKEGKQYSVPHIMDFLTINEDIFSYNNEELILDGELYIHGEILGDIASAVNSTNLNSPRVKFVLFDLAIEGFTNLERWNIIKNHIKPKLDQHINCCIEPIRTFQLTNDASVQLITDKFIKEGYEGSILRQPDGKYAFGKRPQDMTKLKRVIDEEFTITDVVPQDVDPTKGLYVCVTKNGNVFKVTPKGTDEFKQYVLNNKADVIGKQLTCTFYEWTDKGLPYHVIDNIIRDYE